MFKPKKIVIELLVKNSYLIYTILESKYMFE